MCKIFLNFASCILSSVSKFDSKNHRAVFEIQELNLAGHAVAIVTYSVMKIITTCLPMIGQVFDTMIVASIDNEG